MQVFMASPQCVVYGKFCSSVCVSIHLHVIPYMLGYFMYKFRLHMHKYCMIMCNLLLSGLLQPTFSKVSQVKTVHARLGCAFTTRGQI